MEANCPNKQRKMAGPGGREGTRVTAVFGWFRKNALVTATIAAVLLGALLGSLIRLSNPSSQARLKHQEWHCHCLFADHHAAQFSR